MINILFVTHAFFPAEVGGDGQVAKDIISNLKNRFNFEILTTNVFSKKSKKFLKSQTIIKNSLKINYLKIMGKFGNSYIVYNIFKVNKIVKQNDIIHLFTFRSLINIPVIFLALLHKKKIILSAHGSVPRIGIQKVIYDSIFGFLFQKINFLHALTEIEKIQYKKNGFKTQQIFLIPNGISNKSVQTKPFLRQSLNIPNNNKIILYFGRIDKRKGINYLIEAFNLLIIPNVTLVIVGQDFGIVSDLRKLINISQKKNNIFILNYIYGNKKWSIFDESNVFVLPSRGEGFPMVLLEASKMGIPTISSDQASCILINKFKIGLCVDQNPEDIASKIEELLTNQELNLELKSNCYLFTKKFSLNSVSIYYKKMYHSLIQV